MTINVFIADDHPAIVDNFKKMFAHEKDLNFIGEAHDEQELQSRMSEKTDVLLLDVFEMGTKNFLCLLKEIARKFPLLKILILSGKENLGFARQTIEAGANGYLSKGLKSQEISHSIKDVYKFPSMTLLKLTNPDPDEEEGQKVKQILTPRQLQVISLLCRGFKNNEEIAGFLGKINNKPIKAGAVQAHRRDIRAKLREFGITNDASMGFWTAKWNLLDGSELSSSEDDED